MAICYDITMDIVQCKDKMEASEKALKLLKQMVGQDTLLLLSGGASPNLLYRLISSDRTLHPGAVMLIDERYGLVLHGNSNEKMIIDTGFVGLLNNEGIHFYGILKKADLETTARDYEQIARDLFSRFPKKVAIMGIGVDGHTAGIKPGLDYDHNRLVVAYDDKDGTFGKRITLTFEALAEIDEFIILAFGESKKEALKKMPSSFYAGSSGEVHLFTDIVHLLD